MPNEIELGLASLAYIKPSIIQAISLPHIIDEPKTNYLFQAISGSGKTGAFGVQALLKVEVTVEKFR